MDSDEDKIRKYGSINAADKFMAQKYLNDTDYIIIKIKEYVLFKNYNKFKKQKKINVNKGRNREKISWEKIRRYKSFKFLWK